MVTDSYAYDAWGNLIDRTGDTEQPYQYVGRLGYYTHYQAPTFNLLQLGVRFYDPEIGRFTQRDPIKSGLDWYAYVEDAPTVWSDPSGLVRWWGPIPIPDPNPRWARCFKKCVDTLSVMKKIPVISYVIVAVTVWVEHKTKKWVCESGRRVLKTVIEKIPVVVYRLKQVVTWTTLATGVWEAGIRTGCGATCFLPWYQDFWENY